MESLTRAFRGTLSELRVDGPAAKPSPDPVCLRTMARHALNYLRGNPDPARNYECKFTLGPLGIPAHYPEWVKSNEYAYDPISLGDTDIRMATQYAQMREMAGTPEADDVERGVLSRVLGYLREDGCAWVNPAAAVGQPVEGLWVLSWTTAKALMLLSDIWWRTGYPEAKRQARNALVALKKIAQWDGDKAWYWGIAPFKEGRWLLDGWCQEHGRNYPFIVEPCVYYWERTGDEEGLALAKSFTEGFLAGSQADMRNLRIHAETGAFEKHVHCHTHAVWGVAHLGAVLNERRYLDWARKVYEFVLAKGTDYGWYPEFIPQPEYRAEICVVGDMVSLAAWLARGGWPHYWDHVERTVRNEIRAAQFSLTPAFLEVFNRLHAGKPRGVREQAIAQLRRLEGGFVAQPTFDDWVGYPSDKMGQPGIARNGIHMMGCCPPEGMRALWEAWQGVVEERPEGLFVNMAFNRDHPAAKVVAYRPEDGRIEVTARKEGAYYLRPPAWADREAVRLTRNGKAEGVVWGGPENAYVVVAAVKTGEVLALLYPVPRFTQTFTATSIPNRAEKVTVQWIGNKVQGVQPRGRHLPMFG